MDFESLEVVERRHIMKALKLVGGNRGRAAKLLGIGRATLYRRLLAWGLQDGEPVHVESGPPSILKDRRHVERLIESHGKLSEVAVALGVGRRQLDHALLEWYEEDKRQAYECARREGIVEEEVDAIFGKITVNQYADIYSLSHGVAHAMVNEALHILGLRRWRSRIHLAEPKSKDELAIQAWRTSTED